MKRRTAPYIFKRGGFWIMRFRETVNDAGTLKTVQRASKLCADSISKEQARKLAEDAAAKLEQSRPANPEMVLSLGDFVARVYLPFAETHLRFWTAKSYRVTWAKHFAPRPRIAGMLLCAVHTSDVYAWLQEIVATDKTDTGETLGAATVKRLKSLLSGVFSLAVNLGYLQTANPVQGAKLPAGAEPKETRAYSLEEIAAMIAALSDPTARVMVAVAAFTGLSRSEIRGLTWEAWQGQELHVLQGIVAGRVQEPKTRARKAPVPLLPSLAQILGRYRERGGNPVTGPMFRTTNGTPVDPNNLLRDRMQPAFKVAGIAWHGWHAFRRGLATNLYALDVQDIVIQRILRHANVSVTQACYIKPIGAESVRALATLDAVLLQNSTQAVGMMLQ
jgi:integrase